MPKKIEIPRYTIIQEIGSGGFAVVYLATQEGLDRTVAVKVLKKALPGSGEEYKKRFEHEGRMLAQLQHENIVKIFDIGATDDAVYMVMEYLRGGTLSEKMQQGDILLVDVIKICARIGLALHAAHQKNIIHRDLKPSNIMFRDSVTPVLTDFGIARKIDLDMTLTATGMMIGTPQYMSPEQIQGKPVDARSDIYSLGLMMYRLLTGELPFKAKDPIALAMQQVNEIPAPLPEELSELQPVIDLMLAKEPADRYQSMLDFCNHLRSISLTGEDYSVELSAATRVFSSSMLGDPKSLTGSTSTKGPVTEASSISRAFSSLGTAVSAVFTQKKPRNYMLGAIVTIVLGIIIASQFFSHGLSDAELKKIDRELNRFNAYLALDQVSSPAGENATETLLRLQEIAPDFSKVEEATRLLADQYETLAYDEFDADKLDEAKKWVDQGLSFAPDHDGLSEIKETLDNRIAERDRLLKIESLLDAGNQALLAGTLIPPDAGNAYEAFQEVRALDLQNEIAEAGLSEIQRRLADQISQMWEAGDRELAQGLLSTGLSLFNDSTLLLELEDGFELELAAEREQQELDRLLALANEQFVTGNIVEPPGYNALESYRQARDLRPGDQGAALGLEKIADHFYEIARARFEANEFQTGLVAAANGLKAVPDHPGLLAAQSAATSRLDAREREIQTRLQQAERFVATGQFIPGQAGMQDDSQNATVAFNQVLAVDPGNVSAIQALASLPGEIDDAVSNLQRDGDLNGARALLIAAQQYYDDQARYGSQIASIDQELAEMEEQQALEQSLAALDRMIDTRPVTVELVDRIAASLRKISGEFPDEVAVSERLSTFITLLGEHAEQVSIGGNDQEALGFLDHSLLLYPSNSRLSQARNAVLARQQDRIDKERERIASLSGILAVDASPWGRVLEVRNRDQVLQDLPQSSDTPLYLTLLEGEYSVVVEAGDEGARFELSADVQRRKVNTVRPDVSLMNSSDYFEKSGW